MGKCFFMGIEDVSWRYDGISTLPLSSTAGGTHDTAFARGALRWAYSDTNPRVIADLLDPDTYATPVGLTSAWLSARGLQTEITGSELRLNSPSRGLFGLMSATGRPLWGIALGGADSAVRFDIVKWDGVVTSSVGGFTVVAQGQTTFAVAATRRFDLHVDMAASGKARLYVDGVLHASFDGDTRIGAATFGRVFADRHRNAALYQDTYFSECFVTDFDSRSTRLRTHSVVLSPVGEINTFASGGAAEVDEFAASDTDALVCGIAGQEFAAHTTDLPANGTSGLTQEQWKKRAVHVHVRANAGPGGPQNLRIGLKPVGGAAVVSPALLLDAALTTRRYMAGETNPMTGLPWTPADLNALQVYLKTEA